MKSNIGNIGNIVKFTSHGYTVKRPAERAIRFNDSMKHLDKRTPFVYHDPSRTLYMGIHSWAHPDVEEHHGINPHEDDYSHGYIGEGGEWHPGVNFYYGQPDNLDEIRQALAEAGYPVDQDYAPTGLGAVNLDEDVTPEDIWDDDDEPGLD